jgi:hypothetical protein
MRAITMTALRGLGICFLLRTVFHQNLGCMTGKESLTEVYTGLDQMYDGIPNVHERQKTECTVNEFVVHHRLHHEYAGTVRICDYRE